MSVWRLKQKQQTPKIPEQRKPSESEKAHAQALASLDQARSKGPEVRRVSDSLRELRRRNHFAAQIEHLFTGGPA